MNKEEILKRSRNENKQKGDEREEKIKLRSATISAAVGALICLVFVVLEGNLFDRSVSHIWVIYSGMMFSKYIINVVKLKKKEDLLFSILWGILALLYICIYVQDNIG